MTRKTVNKSAMSGKGGEVADAKDLSKEKNWGGYVNVPLSDDEKIHFKMWQPEAQDDILPMLYDNCFAGFKFSLAADLANDCWVATFTGKGASKFPYYLLAMSARGGTPEQSIALLVYKHNIVCEGDWSKYWQEKRGFGSEI